MNWAEKSLSLKVDWRMPKLFYPAIFEADEDGAFTVEFPDVDGCVTGGDDMDDAYEMAFSALGLVLSYMEEMKEPIPTPSNPQDIKLEDGQFLVVIEFNTATYRKTVSDRPVEKVITIPEWLNEEASSIGVDFSRTLEDALLERIKQSS